MKRAILLLMLATTFVLSSCSKVLIDNNPDPQEWMRTHERGAVAYVDHYTGNYIVETFRGYAVIESLNGVAPRDFDLEYANFNSWGVQTTYNRTGNYFTQIRVVESRLSWQDALYVFDQINY